MQPSLNVKKTIQDATEHVVLGRLYQKIQDAVTGALFYTNGSQDNTELGVMLNSLIEALAWKRVVETWNKTVEGINDRNIPPLVAAVDLAEKSDQEDTLAMVEVLRQRILSICSPEQREKYARHYFTVIPTEDEVSRNISLHQNVIELSGWSKELARLTEHLEDVSGRIRKHRRAIEANLPVDCRGLERVEVERAVFGGSESSSDGEDERMIEQDGRD